MVVDWVLFATVFWVIALAELPDKTIFATLILATQGQPFATFVGVALAFLVQSLFAVCFGQVLGFLPPVVVQVSGAALFFFFSYSMWTQVHADSQLEKTERSDNFLTSARNAFMVIFLAEWGDLTQLATATFQAKYHQALTIFLAATAALWMVTSIGVVLGSQLRKWIDLNHLRKFASVLFAFMGLGLLIKTF